jgi:hypothetical protein
MCFSATTIPLNAAYRESLSFASRQSVWVWRPPLYELYGPCAVRMMRASFGVGMLHARLRNYSIMDFNELLTSACTVWSIEWIN